MPFNFMAAVTTCSDFGAQYIKSVTASIFPLLSAMKRSNWMLDVMMVVFCFVLFLFFFFLMLSFKTAFSLSSFSLIKRFFSSS